MTTDREIDEILAEIGREHRAIGAPQKLESVLRVAACDRKKAIGTPGLRSAWTWAAAVILLAAVATAGVMWQARRSHESRNREVRAIPVPQVKPGPVLPSERVVGRSSLPQKSAVVRKAASNTSGLSDAPQQAFWSSLDEFVALPVSEGLRPAAEMSVVRIKLKGSDLQQYGLDAPADAVAQTLLAEFVVGEDGLPRAIRIVH